MARELIALALAVCAADAGCSCRRSSDAQGQGQPQGTALAGKPFYRIDPGAAVTCTHDTVCEAHLVLTALGAYHVNKDYPFKFLGEPSPAPPVDGEGSFAIGDATHGTMTVKFRPAAAGTAKLVGTFKLSVCSDDTCEIETPKIELGIPVS